LRLFPRKGKSGTTWYVDFRHKGRRIQRALGKDRKLAEKAALKIELEVFEGKFFPNRKKLKVRFKEFADKYIEEHSKRKKRTWPRDLGSLNKLLPVFGDMYMEYITPKMVDDYRQRREKEGVKPSTVNREHALLKHMFTKAIEWELVKDNPAKRVKMAKETPRVRFLTEIEKDNLLQAVKCSHADYLEPIVITALNTGMRKGEILGLKWEDVDFNRRVVRVRQTKTDQLREVPMTDWLYEILWEWRQKRLAFRYVFNDINDKPIKSFRTAWEVALEKAGIKDFRFHDLRHTFASYMRMAGMDIMSIKEMGGWKTLDMVDRYSHISTERKRAEILIFESVLHPKVDEKRMQMNIESS
jgi:integrase